MNICCMRCEDLDTWVKTKAKPGDVAYWHDATTGRRYYYFYDGPDPNPFWRMWQDDLVEKYLEEINKLKIEDTTVNKRCENCKYFKSAGTYTWCIHVEHAGAFVPKFTSCAEYKLNEERSTPFDNLKFYLKDASTGELDIKYICEDCGKVEDKPFHWWIRLPEVNNGTPSTKRPGYYFRCEECDKKKKGEV